MCSSFYHDAIKRLSLKHWRAVTHRLPYVTTPGGDRYRDQGRTLEIRNCACGSSLSRDVTNECPTCHGDGFVERGDDGERGAVPSECEDCEGTGETPEALAKECA